MRFGLDAETLLEFLEQFALLAAQRPRVLQVNLRDEVPLAVTVDVGDTLAAETVLLLVAGALVELQLDLARQRRNADGLAQGRLGEEDRHLKVDVVAPAHEVGVGSDVEGDVEVAPGAALAAVALARNPQAVFGVDPRGHLDGDALVDRDETVAPALVTLLLDHGPFAVTDRTGLGEGHEALAHVDLTLAAALAAGRDLAVLGAGALTARTGLLVGKVHLFLAAEHRFLEADGHLHAEVEGVLVRVGALTAAATAASEAAEHLLEDAPQVVEPGTASEASGALKPLFAVAVIDRALLVVAEDLVGLVAEFELVFRIRIVGVAVGMVEFCHFTVGFLDGRLVGVPTDFQNLVIA